MKNLFKNYPKIILIILAGVFLFIMGGNFNSFGSLYGSNNLNLAAVPAGWNLNKIRSELNRMERKYEEAYFNGSNPHGNFMKKQEAAMAALRARQYDLEFEEALGYPPPNPYNPKDYTTKNFISDGNPTPRISYDPTNPSDKPTSINGLGALNPSQSPSAENQSEAPWGEQVHHTGIPWGGLVVGPKIPCSCEGGNNYMVPVNEYVSKGTVYIKYEDMKSKAYMYWDLNAGQYGLGTLDLGGVCRINMGQCVDWPVYGIINSGPGFGSSGSTGLSFPSILGEGANLDFMNGGTVPATYTF